MDRKGCSEVEVASLPGVITGDDITNFNTCLNLNNDDTGIVGNPSFSIRIDNDIIVSEILSRLPVKSLMRFKCVSKHWLYLIEEDSYFIYLHLARAKARPSLVYWISLPSVNDQQFSEIRCKGQDEVFLTADLSLEGIGRADIHTMKKTDMFCCDFILRPINGLMCFVDNRKHAVCIYNISTREASPWIQSTLLLDEREKRPEKDALDSHVKSYKFGFDPIRREHKVLCMWYITVGEIDNCLHEDMDEVDVCEIFTVGDGSWRRIHEVPPYLSDTLPCAYVNGSIYWCTDMFITQENWSKPSGIVAFDFGIERFREIQIPEFIRDQPLDPDTSFNRYVLLVELDGCLGIIRRINAFISKLWIFDDQRYGNEKVNTTKSASAEIWIDETITLPFPWTETLSLNVYPVIGTHQMIVQTYQGVRRYMNNVSLHSYHWKEKTFTEITTSGAPLSVPDACSMKMFSTFVESLVPVQRKSKCMGNAL